MESRKLQKVSPQILRAAFWDALGTGMVMPLSLLYFTLQTDVPLAQIGFAASAASIIAIPIGLAGGWLLDKFGSRSALITNNLLAAVGYVLSYLRIAFR